MAQKESAKSTSPQKNQQFFHHILLKPREDILYKHLAKPSETPGVFLYFSADSAVSARDLPSLSQDGDGNGALSISLLHAQEVETV